MAPEPATPPRQDPQRRVPGGRRLGLGILLGAAFGAAISWRVLPPWLGVGLAAGIGVGVGILVRRERTRRY